MSEWIVKQSCGHVSRWVLTTDPAVFNTPRRPSDRQPCKGAPIVGWGEWCAYCRDIASVTDAAA